MTEGDDERFCYGLRNLPRNAPKDTLPMPVADTQKQKKSSRSRDNTELKGWQ